MLVFLLFLFVVVMMLQCVQEEHVPMQ